MRFFRTDRANAGIFFVLGAAMLVSAAVACIDLVRYVEVQGRAARAARVIADYAAREPEVDCHEVRALAEFAHTETLGDRNAGLLVLTLATGDTHHQDGYEEDWTWDPPLAFGPPALDQHLDMCRNHLAANRADAFRALAMAHGESAVAIQLCLAPDPDRFVLPAPLLAVVSADIYQYHVVPIRADDLVFKCV